MNTLQKFAFITVITLSSSLILMPYSLRAQISVPLLSEMNLDELPDDPQQLTTWECTQENQAIAVEVKNVKGWKEIIEKEGWNCTENVPIIPDDANQFSCEPDESSIVGLLTVSWLQGEDARQQMQTWIDRLTNSEDRMICTVDQSNPFWR